MGASSKVLVILAGAVVFLSGCTVKGTPTWPGARLNGTLLNVDDFPPGVQYGRITEQPGQPDGEGPPPAMPSEPDGCADGLTRVIAASAERGPGSSAKFVVAYDGVRIVMTLLAAPLDLTQLETTAARCERYVTYFPDGSEPIPITTTKLKAVRADSLVYRQTLQLDGTESSVYFTFENVGESGMFGIAFPTPSPSISVKGTLPQTFLDITAKQAERLRQR